MTSPQAAAAANQATRFGLRSAAQKVALGILSAPQDLALRRAVLLSDVDAAFRSRLFSSSRSFSRLTGSLLRPPNSCRHR
jgi:hypothetical protein